jgi:hypothetical protein
MSSVLQTDVRFPNRAFSEMDKSHLTMTDRTSGIFKLFSFTQMYDKGTEAKKMTPHDRTGLMVKRRDCVSIEFYGHANSIEVKSTACDREIGDDGSQAITLTKSLRFQIHSEMMKLLAFATFKHKS